MSPAVFAQSYLLSEGFEGAGFENSGWSVFSASDPDEADIPLLGAQSLRCRGVSSFIQRPFSRASDFFGYFRVRWVAFAPYKFVVDWLDTGSASVSRVVTDGFPNRLQIVHGAVSVSGSTVITTGVTYHVWVEWTRGAGSDGTMKLFVSTDGEKPASPEASITNGTGNSAVDKFDVGPFDATGSTDVIYDRILLDDAAIGSNPGGNAPPSISPVPNLATPAGTAIGPVDFTVGDADTNAADLVVTGQSSNTNAVPDTGIVFGGSSSNRTVTITPTPGVVANTTITITVSDGAASASSIFNLAVGNANAPAISGIPNQGAAVNAPVGPISFTVGDVETPAAGLSLFAASSSTGLVPVDNIVFDGAGSNRTVTITPVTNQTGVALITVFVSDGQLTNFTSFTLTVGATNTPPIISDIGDQTTPQDTTRGPIGFVINDAETATSSLTVTRASSNLGLLPLSGIVLGGSGAARTVTLTPTAGQNGTAIVTLTVSDGDLSASDSFVLSVTATNPPNNSDGWLLREGFEGPGYENTGWTQVGNPDPDYSAIALRNAESLHLTGGSLISRSFRQTNQFSLYGRLRWHSLVSGATAFYWETVDFGAAASLSIDFTLPRVFLTHGVRGAAGGTVLQTNVTYHVWLEWARGSGNDGALKLFLSTNVAKPSVPEAVISTGTGGPIERMHIGSTSAAASLIVDSLLVAEEPIGSNPDSNSQPNLSDLPDLTIDEDSSTGPLSFTVGDLETAATNLIVTSVSSNTGLVPDGNIILGGSGSNLTVTVTPAANQFGAATILVIVSDGSLTNTDSFVLTVNSVNDAPRVLLPIGGTNYIENSAPILLDPEATLSDADSPDLEAGTLTVDFLTNGSPDDRLAVRHDGAGPGQIGVSGTDIAYEGVAIATLTEGGNRGGPLVISFTSAVPLPVVQAVLRNITFENVSETPATNARTVRIVVNDGDGGFSEPATMQVGVTGLLDSPRLVWAEPSSIVYGTPLGAAQLNAVADIPGVFAYNPPVGTVLHAGGAQTLSVVFTPEDTNNYIPANATVAISVLPASLRVRADAISRSYGQTNPPFTVSYFGFVNGDTQAALSGDLQLTTPANINSPVGRYPVTPFGLSATNYDISFVVSTLNVTPAPLVAAADNQNKPYAAALPPLTGTLTGVRNGDSLTVSFTTAATAASDAGSYPVTPVLADPNNQLSNYAVTLSNGTLTITPVPLLVSADHKTKTYGAANPLLTVSYSGFVNGDDLTDLDTPASLTTLANPASPVGAYVIAAGGATDRNYAITFTDGVLTVIPAPLRVTANATNRLYGQGNPVFTAAITGFVNGDGEGSLAGSLNFSTTAETNSPAGVYAITPSGLGASANYDLSFIDGALSVTAAPLSITARAASRPYGQTNPPFTVSYAGFVNGDYPGLLSGELLLLTPASTNSPVGRYPVTPFGLDTTNYDISFIVGTLTVTSVPLIVTANHQTNRQGRPLPAFDGTLVGLQSGDNITATFAAAVTAASGAGQYPIMPVLADPDRKLSNYTVTLNDGMLTVLPSGPLNIAILGAAPNGAVTLRVTSDPERQLRLQWTTNFLSWTDLTTLVNPTGAMDHLDTTAIGQPHRFYRAVLAAE